MMKSVKPFFTPATKKCKYRERETSQIAEREQFGEASMKRTDPLDQGTDIHVNTVDNSAYLAPNHTECHSDSAHCFDVNISNNTPLRQEQGREQAFMAGLSQGNSYSQINPSTQRPLFTSPADLGRRWHHVRRKCYRQQRSQNFSFTVVSYNVLADGLLHANSHLYIGAEYWVQQWEYRRRNLLQEILHYNADVLCLQEVENCHYHDWFEPKLRERGYIGLYKKRTGDKTDGCATFFKKSRFTLVKSKLVSFRKPEVKLMDRDNVAVVVLLKPKTTGRASHKSNSLVCVSNTHLLFNKKRGDIKLAQLASLFAEIDEVARISPSEQRDCYYHPTICCGDFNSTPFSPIYDFIVRGVLDYTGMHRDNFSGQNHFRRSYPPSHALTRNLIPWELGVTAACIKRNESPETAEDLCSSSEQWEINSSSTRNHVTSSELCHQTQTVLQFQESKSGLSDCRNAGGCMNTESVGSPANPTLGSTQCTTWEKTEFQLAHCSTSFSQGHACTESQPLNSLNSERVWPEGEQASSDSMVNLTERDIHNACTVQQHHLNFFSVYRHYFRSGQPEVTTFHDRACTTVDYMFVSPGLQQHCRRCRSQHGLLQLTGNLGLLSEDDIWNLGGLPSKFLSSDHLSLVSSFLLHV